jgi:hypothetical protein
LSEQRDLRVLLDRRQPGEPGHQQRNHDHGRRKGRRSALAQPEVDPCRSREAHADVARQHASRQQRAQDDPPTDAAATARPDRQQHGSLAQQQEQGLGLDRPADAVPGPVHGQGQAEHQRGAG